MGDYDIQIGVFSNAKNLHQNIQKIKISKYRHAIQIKKKKTLSYVHAVIRGKGKELKEALATYRTIFPDAFIAKKLPTLHPVVKHGIKPKVITKKPLIKKVIEPHVILDAKSLVSDKSFYLCYEDAPIGLSQRIVEMSFSNNVALYTTLKQKGTLEIPYVITQNSIRLELFDTKMQHKILEDKSDYLLVESYVHDKKMHTLRYYKTKEKALEYLSKR